MKKTNTQETAGQTGEREVQTSRAINIQVEGGLVIGELIGFRTRTSHDGNKYSGWVFQAEKVIAENRENKKPESYQPGRYFVFGATRLDRVLQEVETGERVKVVYLGKEKNETAGPDGTFGQHHAYRVTYQ